MEDKKNKLIDNEVIAMDVLYQTLSGMDKETIVRVLEWLCSRLYIKANFELPKRDRIIKSLKENTQSALRPKQNILPPSIRTVEPELESDDEEDVEYESKENLND